MRMKGYNCLDFDWSNPPITKKSRNFQNILTIGPFLNDFIGQNTTLLNLSFVNMTNKRVYKKFKTQFAHACRAAEKARTRKHTYEALFSEPAEAVLQAEVLELQEREASLQEREASLQEREASLQDGQALLQEGEALLQEREDLFTEREKLLNTHERTVAQRERTVALQHRDVEERAWGVMRHVEKREMELDGQRAGGSEGEGVELIHIEAAPSAGRGGCEVEFVQEINRKRERADASTEGDSESESSESEHDNELHILENQYYASRANQRWTRKENDFVVAFLDGAMGWGDLCTALKGRSITAVSARCKAARVWKQ